ncbi:phage tail assembly protein [Herbaspirillum sp.]|uniref:phage tail assembly protein n=1 Tax=Herbaspirillum sp. TaxID=1890675 RepID=UPI001B07A46D|nr:phage tail assembly protein [Herbaspirillum sp.]MBO9538765.1 phage tail assembly protein [Herbaspirillum sp.]
MAKLTLIHPIQISDKKTIDTLTFRDYTTASDYLSFDKRGAVLQRLALIASLTGTDETLIERLRGVDYRRAEAMADAMIEGDEKEFNDERDAQKKLQES